ncbi:MAG TPA: F0F1 ATP synthase subunit delta [Sandaracinaceae bacterium]
MRIDGTTLLFETINFVVLVLVLWRILYRPLRESIDARRHAIREEQRAAERARADAEALQNEWRHKHEELEALRARVRADVLDGAEKERAAILERAREDARAELLRVRQLLTAEREAAERWVRAAVVERGTDLAGRMLLALAPQAVDAALANRLIDVLAERGAEIAKTIGEAEPEVELTGAHLPDAALAERIASVLRTALGRPVRLSTRGDGSLVAGFTVRVGDRLFDASIAGELAALRSLAHDLEDAHGGSVARA